MIPTDKRGFYRTAQYIYKVTTYRKTCFLFSSPSAVLPQLTEGSAQASRDIKTRYPAQIQAGFIENPGFVALKAGLFIYMQTWIHWDAGVTGEAGYALATRWLRDMTPALVKLCTSTIISLK